MNILFRRGGCVILGFMTVQLLLTGCSAGKGAHPFVHEYSTVENDYEVTDIVYEQNNTAVNVVDVLSNDDVTVIIRSYYTVGSGNDHSYLKSVINAYDNNLNEINEYDIPDDADEYRLVGDKLYIAGAEPRTIRQYIAKTGERLDDITVDVSDYSIASSGNYLFIVKQGTIVCRGSDGREITINDDRIDQSDRYMGIIDCKGKAYMSSGYSPSTEYYYIDTDHKSLEQVADSDALNGMREYTDRDYYFDYDGPAFVDFESRKVRHIRLLDYIDVIPPESSGVVNYYAVANNNYVASHSYTNGKCRIELIRDKGIANTNVNKAKIVIGGYGMRGDICLGQAVYRFNIEDPDYRIVLDDYSMQYSYTSADEAQAQKLKLLAYFKENGYPDILYGNFWDFDHMGRNGELLDLSDCITEDIGSRMVPSIKKLLESGTEGKVYSVWAGFDIAGYWGEKEVFEGCSTLGQLDKIYDSQSDGKMLFNAVLSMDLADSAISYQITSMIDNDIKARFTVDDIEQIIRFAVRHGITLSDKDGYSMTDWDVINGDYMLQGGRLRYNMIDRIRKIEEESGKSLCYIGFPSVYGSSKMILPHCLLAVPESSDHPQQCKRLISHIYDEDIQSRLGESGQFAAACDDTSDLPGSVRDAINSVNYVKVTDWGIYSIIFNEMESYYNNGKDTHSTAESMTSRINLYLDENYG